MAANESTNFTNFSNVKIGTASGGGRLFLAGTEVTATAAELNAAADVSSRAPVVTTDAATYTLLAANSGILHVVPDLTADCTFSFPTPAAGLTFEIMYGGAAADAQDWIFDTVSASNYFVGGVVHLDTDAGSAGDEVVPVYSDGNSNSIFTVLTPEAGTVVKWVCDGTLWYLNGQVVSATAPTMADQA